MPLGRTHLDRLVGYTSYAARVALRERHESDGEFRLHLQRATLRLRRGGMVVDGGEWAPDVRARAEGNEGCIRADVSDDVVQLPARVPRDIEFTDGPHPRRAARTHGRTLCS